MKLIYSYTVQSKSFTDNTWAKHEYWLCDDMTEYLNAHYKYLRRQKKVQEEFDANPEDVCAQYKWFNYHYMGQRMIEANEYYQGHEWCGKHFIARGFSWSETIDGNMTAKYFLMPDSIKHEGVSEKVGKFNGYGS